MEMLDELTYEKMLLTVKTIYYSDVKVKSDPYVLYGSGVWFYNRIVTARHNVLEELKLKDVHLYRDSILFSPMTRCEDGIALFHF